MFPLRLIYLFILLAGGIASAESNGRFDWTEEELLKDLIPEPAGVPPNDPWALPLVDGCPRPCEQAGLNPANWTQLQDREYLLLCNKTLLFEFNVQNTPNRYSTIRTCALGTGEIKRATTDRPVTRSEANGQGQVASAAAPSGNCGARESVINVIVRAGPTVLNERSDAVAAAEALASHLESSSSCGTTLLLARSGAAVVGLYTGGDVQKKQAAKLIRNQRQVQRRG